MKYFISILFLFFYAQLYAQDSILIYKNTQFQLTDVVVRDSFKVKDFIDYIKEDTSFYKAFKNLRVLEFTSFNDIKMYDKNKNIEASLFSKTKQIRTKNCRTMQVLEEKVVGNFYDKTGNYNYTTADLYASLFFTKETICGETNIVKGVLLDVKNKKGIDKHKEQLKMLFFNPGQKIPGIPLMGDKVDVYDKSASKIYDYKIDKTDYYGTACYIFTITPKQNISFFRRGGVVFDKIVTWFNAKTLEIIARNYSLSYRTGIYSFNVDMEVEMTNFNDLLVPKVLRYNGFWNVLFKKKEISIFTATLFDFNKEN